MTSPNDKQTSSSLAGYQSTVVDHAHRVFYGEHQDAVRQCLKDVFAEDSPFARHKLQSALAAAGIVRKPDRERTASYLIHSPKFKEELARG